MTKHAINETCPICRETQLEHVHCAHPGCTFVVTTCPRCDREQAVRAFVADHEGDCEHRATAPFERVALPATAPFVRRVA